MSKPSYVRLVHENAPPLGIERVDWQLADPRQAETLWEEARALYHDGRLKERLQAVEEDARRWGSESLAALEALNRPLPRPASVTRLIDGELVGSDPFRIGPLQDGESVNQEYEAQERERQRAEYRRVRRLYEEADLRGRVFRRAYYFASRLPGFISWKAQSKNPAPAPPACPEGMNETVWRVASALYVDTRFFPAEERLNFALGWLNSPRSMRTLFEALVKRYQIDTKAASLQRAYKRAAGHLGEPYSGTKNPREIVAILIARVAEEAGA